MHVICKVVRTDEERDQAFRVRNEVFVKEQGLFASSDVDEYDRDALHIIAECEERVVGTVRVYQEGRELWMGGRLAVVKEYRTGKVGSVLVKEAMKTVKSRGARCFLAFIQSKNVRYFRRLGWKPVGPTVLLHGVSHQRMEADLDRV